MPAFLARCEPSCLHASYLATHIRALLREASYLAFAVPRICACAPASTCSSVGAVSPGSLTLFFFYVCRLTPIMITAVHGKSGDVSGMSNHDGNWAFVLMHG